MFDVAAGCADIGQEGFCTNEEPAIFMFEADPAGFGTQTDLRAQGQCRALAVRTGFRKITLSHNGPFNAILYRFYNPMDFLIASASGALGANVRYRLKLSLAAEICRS